MAGTLYIVPTPIGNLEDITLRAVRLLKEVDFILAEDTRHSRKLLDHLGISTRLYSHHKFNERNSAVEVCRRLEAGEDAALISDAGTPLISDPGNVLLQACIESNIPLSCLPGPTSIIPALVISGMDTSAFTYLGFPPAKKGRQTFMRSLAEEKRTLVLLESPHKLMKSLEQLAEVLGAERRIAVCRELSKKFEECYRGSLAEAVQHFREQGVKGEFVLVIGQA